MSVPSLTSPETLIHAFCARPAVPTDAEDCPHPEDLFDAAGGRLSRGRRLRILDHAGICGQCGSAWQLAASLQGGALASAGQPGWPVDFRWAAAGVVALTVTTVLWWGVASQPVPGYRGGDVPAPQSRLEPGALPRGQFLLRWSDAPRGASYTLRITDAGLKPVLVEQGLTRSEFLVPATALREISAGERLLWQVEARLPDGTGSVSPTYFVTVQ